MLIFVLQARFWLASLFLKVKQGLLVLGGARKRFSNLFFSSQKVYFRGEYFSSLMGICAAFKHDKLSALCAAAGKMETCP